MKSVWRVTQPIYNFEAPSPTSITQLMSRFSVGDDSVIYCSKESSTALRESLQSFYQRKRSKDLLLPLAWRRQHALLKGVLVHLDGEIIDIENPIVQRELDIYLGKILDKYAIPHIDTGILRGNCPEITQAVSDWVFRKKRAAGILYRSKFESDGICYALYSSRVTIKVMETHPLINPFHDLYQICQEYGLKLENIE